MSESTMSPKDHAALVHASNEDMRARLREVTEAGIRCKIPRSDGRFYTWREWFEFLGFREDGYPLNG